MTTPEKAKELFFAALDAQNRKQFDAAEQLYREALVLAPERPSILNNLATVLQYQGRYAEALKCCERLLVISPEDPGARNNLGNVLAALGRHDEALLQFEHALRINPDFLDALASRGWMLAELGRHAEALNDTRRAAALAPDRADFQSRLGNVLVQAQQPDAAICACDRALAIDPQCADAYQNRGNARLLLGRYTDALLDFASAQALLPDHPYPRWNEALCRLLLGDFERGWTNFSRGWEIGQRGKNKPQFTQPVWDGARVEGTLLVWGEQGIGDQILFGSMLEQMRPFAQRLIVAVDPRLVPLMQRSYPDMSFVSRYDLPGLSGFDMQVAMGDLGVHLRRSWDSFPVHRNAFLTADADRTQQLRKRLSTGGKLICGISWRSTNAAVGGLKSMALADLSGILAIPGVKCVDLQYGDTAQERSALLRDTGLELAHFEDIDNFHDVDELASLIDACDIVVSVSNTTVHLAGALGKPTMVMLPYALGRIWYWHEKRDRSPWYPACRLVRQTVSGEWGPVIAAATAAVQLAVENNNIVYKQ